MSIGEYLPSSRFVTIAASLLVATAMAVGAQYLTGAPGSGTVQVANQPAPDPNWQQTLEEIQLESGISAPQPPSPEVVNAFLAEAKDDNLTSSIGRTLLVNLSAANAEGLGSDAPTQDSIVEAAAVQVGAGIVRPYSTNEVNVVPQNKDSLYIYGNQLITTLRLYPAANSGETLYAFGAALDYQDASRLGPVRAAQEGYKSLAAALMQMPVPETLAPLHVQVANNLAMMGSASAEMATVLSDPLRGLGGLQVFRSSEDESVRLLTAIAGIFNNNGILFSKDDPGSAWSAFVASP